MGNNVGIMRSVIELIRLSLRTIGVDVRRYRGSGPAPLTSIDIFKALLALREQVQSHALSDEEISFLEFCAHNADRSCAQLMQDLFVLFRHHEKRDGFFVEFGATDGASLSNTLLLERGYGWRGVVAEPARCWHEQLRANRICTISTDCVWSSTGQTLMFKETAERELSTVANVVADDSHAADRVHGQCYEVRTISLMDLLARANAPRRIDYLSVDTEGSEFEILDAFDFYRYDIDIISVEHNFTPNRKLLLDLLTQKGFERKFEALSQWEDWYVRV